jgi:2-polyprenyl-3-methyl-5-hydroxy-6-metoxy-1,4-benzoquinol methylase
LRTDNRGIAWRILDANPHQNRFLLSMGRVQARGQNHQTARIENGDVGAGYPAKLPLLGDVKEITLVDQSTLAPLVARDIPHVAFVPDDLENPTKLRERKFDLVICADVLEHLMDPDPCLQFIKNSTARFAVLSTPERDVVRGVDCMTSPKAEHVREWNADESRRYVESSGFDVIDQLLMPQGRLSQFKKSLASILGLKSKRWAGCQTIVCAPRK